MNNKKLVFRFRDTHAIRAREFDNIFVIASSLKGANKILKDFTGYDTNSFIHDIGDYVFSSFDFDTIPLNDFNPDKIGSNDCIIIYIQKG